MLLFYYSIGLLSRSMKLHAHRVCISYIVHIRLSDTLSVNYSLINNYLMVGAEAGNFLSCQIE